jgi:hypothetical protein
MHKEKRKWLEYREGKNVGRELIKKMLNRKDKRNETKINGKIGLNARVD